MARGFMLEATEQDEEHDSDWDRPLHQPSLLRRRNHWQVSSPPNTRRSTHPVHPSRIPDEELGPHCRCRPCPLLVPS